MLHTHLLGHPVKQYILRYYGVIDEGPPPFATRVMDVVKTKFNAHLYKGTVEGYGFVLYPKK